MKKSLLALAVLGAFTGVASAQSSVTIFGVVDAAVRWADNDVGDLWSMQPDGLSTNRLGFRGIEDLGGGLKAGFWLEHGFRLDSGELNTASKFWNRRATVSVISDSLGELRLGRDYTATYWNLTEFDPFGTNGVGSSTILFPGNVGLQAVDTLVRADNVIGYFLPANLGGIYGQAQYALSEGDAVANRNNMSAHGRIGYKAGPLNAAVSYGQTWTPGPDRLTALNVGASWDFGFMQLLGQFAQLAYGDTVQDLTRSNYLLGVTVPVGAGVIRASYIYSDFKNDGPACIPDPVTPVGSTTAVAANCDNAQMFNLGYVHNLSKRTALYTSVSLIDNDDNSRIVHPGGPSVTAVPGANGEKSTAFEVGLRHAF